MPLDDISSLQEAAKYLRITPKQLTNLATGPRPRIGSLLIGRVRVFPRSVIETFITGAVTQAAAPNPWGLTDGAHRNLQKRARAEDL
jgi:hypothetical protein